jgi:hypothetical protein
VTILSFDIQYHLGPDCSMVLYRGRNVSDRPFFAYLRCNRKGIELLEADFMRQASRREIGAYGAVMYIDFRPEPDARAEQFLKRYREESLRLETA